MRRLFASLFVGILLSVPAFAACAQMITAGEGANKQVFFLSDSYVINGVQFCEYSTAPTGPAPVSSAQ
ncbi:MAG TPA: hypothetical protein VK422_22235 [Pyrinomonadaceae bacterium]|nr:hypothetical protein [Pyrinomonadaceae bacterium]